MLARWKRQGKEAERKETQSYYSILRLLTLFWNTVSTETCLLKLSLEDVSCIRIFLCTSTAYLQPIGISQTWALSEPERVFKGIKKKKTFCPLVFICNPLNKLPTSYLPSEKAHLVVTAIPVMGVLFFSLSTSIVKSSFRKRNPIMENR